MEKLNAQLRAAADAEQRVKNIVDFNGAIAGTHGYRVVAINELQLRTYARNNGYTEINGDHYTAIIPESGRIIYREASHD